jgi:pyruvate,water dikinase
MHDRHWKIHWMLNFAQLSATLNLRAVMEKTHGKIDEVLLGRLQNSGNDRNWDKIGALWEMKEEVKADPVLAEAFQGLTAADIIPVLESSERGRRFIGERVVPYQKEYGWHAVWSHEFVFPTFREDMTPVIQLIRDQYSSDYDFPSKVAALRADIDAAARQILEGLEGEALEEMRAANDINLKMAPLTPDHHFYIDQGANAHVRLVLIAIGEKLVELGVLDQPDDVVFFRYNQLRVFIGDPSGMDGRAVAGAARAKWLAANAVVPKDWVGTVTATQLAFPYLNLWGFPDKFYRSSEEEYGKVKGIAGSPGVVEGIARVVGSVEQFDSLQEGEILVCQMTNPAWQVLYGKIIAVVTDAGGPGPRVRHPGGRRHLGRHLPHQDRGPAPRRRQRRRRGDPRDRRGRPRRRNGLTASP